MRRRGSALAWGVCCFVSTTRWLIQGWGRLEPRMRRRGSALAWGVLLCSNNTFVDPRVRKIRNEASSCRCLLLLEYITRSPGSPFPYFRISKMRRSSEFIGSGYCLNLQNTEVSGHVHPVYHLSVCKILKMHVFRAQTLEKCNLHRNPVRSNFRDSKENFNSTQYKRV